MIDRRGAGGGMRMGGLRMGSGMRRGGGAGALVLVAIVVVALIMGIDPITILDPQGAPPPVSTAGQDELRDFAAVVLADTEDVWEARFQAQGRDYTPVPIVLYTARTTSGCGMADSAIGPFYCPPGPPHLPRPGFLRPARARAGRRRRLRTGLRHRS